VTVDAKKNPLIQKEALRFARSADVIVASKGKKVVRFDLKKEKLSDEALAAAIIGPSGNLRAPAVRVGKTLLVGFDEGMYREALDTA